MKDQDREAIHLALRPQNPIMDWVARFPGRFQHRKHVARAVQRKCLAPMTRGGALRHRMNEQFRVRAPALRPAGQRSRAVEEARHSHVSQRRPTILSFPQALGSAQHLHICQDTQQGIIFGPDVDHDRIYILSKSLIATTCSHTHIPNAAKRPPRGRWPLRAVGS